MMEFVEYENEIYYFVNNRFVDSSFILVDKEKSTALYDIYFNRLDIEKMDSTTLLETIKKAKDSENFPFAKKAITYGIDKFSDNYLFIRTCLPIYTSVCRSMNMPEQAIEYTKPYVNSMYVSSAFLTSLYATYCDINDFYTAKKIACRAYAMQGGSKGFNELSLVFQRINKELK